MMFIPERLYGLGFFACLIYAKGDPITLSKQDFTIYNMRTI